MSWRPAVEQRARHIRDLRSGDITASAIGKTLCEPVTKAERDKAVSRITSSRQLLARYGMEPDWQARNVFVLDVAASMRQPDRPRPRVAPGVALDLTEARARRAGKRSLPENQAPPNRREQSTSKPRRKVAPGVALNVGAARAARDARSLTAACQTVQPAGLATAPRKPRGATDLSGPDGQQRWLFIDPELKTLFASYHRMLTDLITEGPFDTVSITRGGLNQFKAGETRLRRFDDGTVHVSVAVAGDLAGAEVFTTVRHELGHVVDFALSAGDLEAAAGHDDARRELVAVAFETRLHSQMTGRQALAAAHQALVDAARAAMYAPKFVLR